MTIYITKMTHKKSGRITIGNVFTNRKLAEETILYLRLQAPEWSWVLEERELV